jgi:CHAT domain-containing protein/Tfp pilus assembly protein PilF
MAKWREGTYKQKTMFSVPVLLLALLASADFNAAFEARDVGRLMRLWDESSPTRIADRDRIAVLARDNVKVMTDGSRVTVRDPGGTLLEEFELEMKGDRIWSLKPLPPATPLAAAREQLYKGFGHQDAGELDAASAAYTRALELADASGHAATRSHATRAIGAVAEMRGDVPAAVSQYEKALEIARAAGNRFFEARAIERLGQLEERTGELDRAEQRYREALQIYRDGGHPLTAGGVLIALGVVHNGRGDYKASWSAFTEAAQIFERLGEAEGHGDALNMLGVVARVRGSHAESAALLRRAMDLFRSMEDLAGIATAQSNLAVTLSVQGQYAEAVTAYSESLALLERRGRYHSVMFTLANLGEMYHHLGDYEQAREHFQRALEMAEKAGFKPGISIVLHNLAQVQLSQDDPHGAIELFEKSLAIDQAAGDKPSVGRTLHNIGLAYVSAGDRARARSSFEKALAIAEEVGRPEARVISLGMLAEVTDEPERSLELAEQTVAAALPTYAPDLLWTSHLEAGRALRRVGRLDDAAAALERAIAIVEELRRAVPGEEIEQQQAFSSMVTPYREMVGVLVDKGDVAGALAYAERGKARALVDVLRNGRPDFGSALTDAERAREAQLAAQLGDVNLEHRDALVRGEAAPELLTRLRKARLEYEAFLDALFAAHPQLREEHGDVLPARATDASLLLARGAADAFLEYVVTGERTYLFVITTDGGIRVHTIPAGRRELKNEVMQYRELLATHGLTYGRNARALYDLLLAPAAAQLRGKRTICIVPDGSLWELPFQTLQSPANEFLLDRHAVYLAPSLTVLRETTREAAPHGAEVRLLAFGDPVMPAETPQRTVRVRRDASLAPLPHTEKEVRDIAALYGPRNSRVHLRHDAREEVVKAEAGRYDVLHFATHGVLDDQNALYSRLVFSPPSKEGEDGLLEAREIMRLDLRARLAVLSACETARGRVGDGEGLIGLSWALFVAGVPTTVVSQWSVDSASTAELMIDFHRNLRADGRSTAEALRLAALATRNKPKYRHPFYWAPFVVVGNAR